MPLMAMPALGAPAEGTPAVGIRDWGAGAERAASFARWKLRCTVIFSKLLRRALLRRANTILRLAQTVQPRSRGGSCAAP